MKVLKWAELAWLGCLWNEAAKYNLKLSLKYLFNQKMVVVNILQEPIWHLMSKLQSLIWNTWVTLIERKGHICYHSAEQEVWKSWKAEMFCLSLSCQYSKSNIKLLQCFLNWVQGLNSWILKFRWSLTLQSLSKVQF